LVLAVWVVLPMENSSFFAINCSFFPKDCCGAVETVTVLRRGGSGGGGCSTTPSGPRV
jgi:hypothetical protein